MPELPRRAVIAITSYNEPIYADGKRTGLFYTEALHPYEALVKAGFEVDLASETGTYGMDEHSTDDAYLTKEDKKTLNNPNHPFNVELNKKLHKASDLDPSKYGLFFASAGHATLWDYPKAKGLISLAEDIYKRGGVVSAVCHGPAILPFIRDLNSPTHDCIIRGKTVTGFTDLGEQILKLDEFIKKAGVQTIEEGAAKVGARYVAPAQPFDDFSLTDGKVVTGANPASAHSTADKAIKAFDS
ncbi:plasma membrane heat shock protein [Mycoemilia scoparia]|uniref:D-lactate dehydratase n=1 Tax=Mycoemilia scoparia TaxID=417184 RepID=A0A9W7ZX30_9FUNG|nr:plasma membrane heat shock protein [Mycoemilia scoparia]